MSFSLGEKVFYLRSTHYSGNKKIEYVPATITIVGPRTYEVMFENGMKRRALPKNLSKEKK